MNQYEGMFLLDNQVVRTDYKTAKAVVTDTLKKHGAEIVSARRWDERRLAYPMAGRQRATFMLTYFKAGPNAITGIRRDAELDERILRHLLLKVEEVPATELELSLAEGDDYAPPPPPADDAIDREEPLVGAIGEDGEVIDEDAVPEDVGVSLNDLEEV
ncbi:MAG: 30S ribosomal protein S6 [Planctomycetota bacterium]|nr:30S ribosomal protein S6 [Planctomycetota bacterium]